MTLCIFLIAIKAVDCMVLVSCSYFDLASDDYLALIGDFFSEYTENEAPQVAVGSGEVKFLFKSGMDNVAGGFVCNTMVMTLIS